MTKLHIEGGNTMEVAVLHMDSYDVRITKCKDGTYAVMCGWQLYPISFATLSDAIYEFSRK